MKKLVLHVGCGLAPLPERFARDAWDECRVDIDPAVRPDVVGSITDLSAVASGSVDAVYASHNLEHVESHQVPQALAEFKRVLRPGGVAWILTPDVQSLAQRIAEGRLDDELYRAEAGAVSVVDVLWGHGAAIAAGRHPMAHRTGFSAATLGRKLAEAGFDPVQVQRRPAAFELLAMAGRPLVEMTAADLLSHARAAQSAQDWARADVMLVRLTAMQADDAAAWVERSIVSYRLGRLHDAADHARHALALDARNARAALLLGSYLLDLNAPAQAATVLRRAVALDPLSCEAHFRFGRALRALGERAGAETSLREALRLEPRHQLARLELAHVLFALWRDREALGLYAQAAAHIDDPLVHSNLLMQLNWSAEVSDADVFAAHRAHDARFLAALAPRDPLHAHANPPVPARRLRIGFLSRDLVQHAMRHFLLPLVEQHDRQAFALCFYHLADRHDEVTARYRQHAEHWVEAAAMNDDALAEKIRADGIDVLVDLAGHTDRNRARVLARRPAPVQITYLGYPTTTCLSAFDGRISDRFIDPEPPAPALPSSEPVLRLAHGYFCYQPDEAAPAVGPLPFDRNGFITFGSLSHAPKLNRPLLATWAGILQRVPGSRLLLQNIDAALPPVQAQWRAEFVRLGVDPARLQFRPLAPTPAHLRSYLDIDIALDSHPYNGGTTTCEALWMGVPVVSRSGGRQVSRLGLSLLSPLGLQDLVADSAKGSADIAVALAANPGRLRELRAGLRQRMQAAPLMDAPGFAREWEAALRGLWARWCAAQGAAG